MIFSDHSERPDLFLWAVQLSSSTKSMRYSRSPSKDPNASSQCGTPNESVSKWKIPHYYRRSSGQNVTPGPDMSTSYAESQVTNNNINIMTTPKQVQLQETAAQSKKKSTRGKGKKGEMVFVNYTVKDAKPIDPTLKKKKSPKSRMLKIFSSSSHHSDRMRSMPTLATSTDTIDTPPLSSASTPSSATKRSYASFLRYGRLNSSTTVSSPASVMSEEVVPRSAPLPSMQRPQLGRSLSANVSLVNNNGRASLSMGPVENTQSLRCNTAQADFYNGEENDDTDEVDHHYLDQYHGIQGNDFSRAASEEFNSSNHLHGTNSMHQSDENDASIAFSKMFTRKRANTGGSMSSMVSSGTSSNLSTLHRNLSTNSVSSLSNRYSPIRTGSPARQTSNLRGSSHRLSRELTSLHSSTGFPVDLALGLETYLDTHTKQRQNHRRKQDSISDLNKSQVNIMSSQYNGAVSSTSSSSTPGVIENSIGPNNGTSVDRSNSTVLSLEHESSLENDILEEQEETPPTGDIPAIKGIPRNVKDGQGEAIYDTASGTNMSFSSGTVISSMTNSQSTLNSSAISYGNISSTKTAIVESGNVMADAAFPESHFSMKLENDRDDEFFNMYMQLNLEGQEEFITDCGAISMPADNSSSRLLENVHGDTSTVTSLLNNSPATITTGNNINITSNLQDESNANERLHNNFTNRIMHDIDQIAQSLNVGEADRERSQW